MMKRSLKKLLYGPVSPGSFRNSVALLRKIGVLRSPSPREDRAIGRIFVPHPFSKVGDLVLLLPLLEKLHALWPQAAVDVAVGAGVSDLLAGVQGLNQIFPCDSPQYQTRVIGRYQRTLRDLLIYKRLMMANDYDLAIVPQWGALYMQEPAFLAFLTGATRRYGYSATVDEGDPELDTLLTDAIQGGAHEQGALRNLSLLSSSGLAPLSPADHEVANRPIRSMVNLAKLTSNRDLNNQLERISGHVTGRYGVIAPAAAEPFRAYPADHFAELLRILSGDLSLPFLLAGGKADTDVCDQLASRLPDRAVSIAGKTDLKLITAIVANSRLFVGNDSGIAHIAGAVGVPTVVISSFPACCREDHPNSPERSRPCGPNVRVIQPAQPLDDCWPTCQKTTAHCISQVSVKDVVEAVHSVLRAAVRA